MTVTKAEFLQQVRQLLGDPNNWTQGVYARDRVGISVNFADPDAVKFCLRGACFRVHYDLSHANPDDLDAVDDVLVEAERCLEMRSPGQRGVPSFNDNPDTTHEDVLRLIDGCLT